MLYKTRYKKTSDYSKEWEGPGVRVDDTIINSYYLANNDFSDAKTFMKARESTYFMVPNEVPKDENLLEDGFATYLGDPMVCSDSDHVLMVTPEDVPKGLWTYVHDLYKINFSSFCSLFSLYLCRFR
jgi:hypothetical protein